MFTFRLVLVSLIFILITSGCKKDELTLPVKVYFKIGISHETSIDYLDFKECQIGIHNIIFEGKREAGGDIFFETDYKVNLPTLSFLQPAIISDFDIPQGIYNYMKWNISLKCIDTGGLIEPRDENLPCIGVVISGEYTSLTGSVIPFIFALDQPEKLSVQAYPPLDKPHIVLSVDKEYEATILFDLGKTFNPISRESFEKAEMTGDIGNQKIIISSLNNKSLYQILSYRIFQSAEAIVKNK